MAGVLMLLAAAGAQADVVNVDTGTAYDTFAEAYSAASSGQTLELDDGTYALSDFMLDKAVDIRAKNMGGAVIAGDGIATGYPVVISASITLSGLQFTAATAAFSLRDQDVTVQVEDAVFHGMNHGVTHQNTAGGTVGQIVLTRVTFHDLVEEAVYVNNGGAVIVSEAVFVDVPGLGLLLGDNEGPDTLQISNYVLANTPNTVNDPGLATLTGLVGGTPQLADPDNGYFALVEGSAGAAQGFGIGLAPAPRATVTVTGNGQAVANGAMATSPDNLTHFGSMHVSGDRIHLFSIENAGFADDLSLTPMMGELVRVTGDDEDQFSVLTQPPSDTIAPQESTGFEIYYTPTAVGAHQTDIIFNNDVENPFVFRVTGTATNTDPVASDDTASVDEDDVVTVTVLANDTDADGDALTVSSATLVSGQGTVTHQPNAVEFVPDADFNGPASVNYVATDGYASDSATIDITVAPVNDAPVATADSATTVEDTPVVIDVLANDTDVDGDDLSIASAAVDSGGGDVAVSGNALEYTPAADSTGQATLSYVVSDGTLSDAGSVSVTVTAVNDPPVAVADSASTAEDTPVVVDVLANDSDPEGDTLTLSSAVVDSGGGSVVIMGGVLEYTPAADSTETATLSYVVSDGELTDAATVTVTVSPVNDAPVAVADNATTVEDTPVVIDVLANDTDVDGDALSISSAAVDSGGGSVTINGGMLEYTPPADSTGEVSLRYVVTDGELTDTGAVLVTITSDNDPPEAVADSATTDEDTAVVIDVLANDSDPDGDTLTLSSAAVASGGGSVVIMGGVLEYTPPADSTDDATLSYVVSDGEADDTGTVSVAITPVNDAPEAVADSATSAEDTTAVIDVLANDIDVDGDDLSISSAAVNSGGGSVAIVGGVLEYTPPADSSGTANLSYVVSDGTLTDTGTVSVTITPVNDAPVAAADSTTTAEDTAVSIDVLANDSDVDGDALSISSAAIETGTGTVAITGGVLEYTPAADDTAGATLSYVVTDGDLTDTGSVSVAITPVNDAPVAVADDVTTAEDTAVVIDVLANDTDVDGDALSISSATVESGTGSVAINGDTLEYTPVADATEAAVLRYVVSDGELTDTTTVSVAITPVNDAPVAADDSSTTAEDTPVTIDVLANDTDVDGDTLSISSAVIDSGRGEVVVNGSVLEFTPAADDTQGASIRYVVSDGSLTDTASVSVAVTAVNDAPVAVADSATTDEDTPVRIDALANDTDAEGDALTITSAVVDSGAGAVVINGGQLDFTPAADDTAGATIRYVVSDGKLSDTGSVSVTITPVNDAPVAVADSVGTDEDTPVLIDVLANDTDVDGDALRISSATVESGAGSVVVDGGLLEFTPAANSTEAAVLRYVITDGAATASATVNVSVTPVNDAPAAAPDAATATEDTPVLIDVLANDTDIEGDALRIVSASVSSGAGEVVVNGDVLEYTPAADSTDDATLSYVVSDGQATDTGSVSVTITPVNDAPAAAADSISTNEDTPATIDVLANDSDVDGDALSISSATIESGGGSVAVGDGVLEFTPAADSTDAVTIRYAVSDGALSDTAVVSVSVVPVNDAPVAADDSGTAAEDTPVLIDVLANDGDVDGDALRIASAAVTSGGGSVALRDSLLEYTPAADDTAGATLSYVVTDGALTDTGSVSVAITPVNDPPVARPDTIRGHYLDDITIDVLANDGDIDSNNLFVTAAEAAQGAVSIVDNRLVFGLNGDWIAQTQISYTVSDGELEASTSVTVQLDEYRAPLVIGTGEPVHRTGTLDDAAFSEIFSIAVGVSGNVFATDGHVFGAIDIERGTVRDVIHNEPGHQDGPIGVARFGAIEGMVYDARNGFVYVSEVSKGSIRRFDLRRDQVNTIRRGIAQPLGMALSNDGNTLYVIEHGKARVLELDLLNGIDSVLVGNGSRGFADGVGEDAQIDISVGLTVGPDGTVYLADRGNSRLRAINPDTREITTLSADFVRPNDVVVRDADTLMVLDREDNLIKRLDLTTNTASVVHSTVGTLSRPVAMAIDAAGTLYVADTGNNQVKAFSIDTLDATQSLPITSDLEQPGDVQQGDYFVRDIIGTGYRGAVGGVSRQANLNDPDQVAIGGENIVYHSNRQFTLMRTDLNTNRTESLFPDYATNTLIDATAYGLGVSRWGHINGLSYSVVHNRLYVFAGGNTLFDINLDDNSFTHQTVSGIVTGGDFTYAFDDTIYMADTGGNRIVQIDPETGAVIKAFESRDGVELSSPTDVDIASNGDLYIANWGRREVVRLVPATGELSVYIGRNGGFADGPIGSAVIGGVYGVEFGDNDVLYMADRLNHAVRLVDIRDDTPVVRTIAGDGQPGVVSPDGARFDNPTSLGVDFHGTVVTTDDGNNRIRIIGRDLSRPLSPFDAARDILGTNPDGSAVVEGTLPLVDFPIIRGNSILQAAVAPIPMFLVDADEREQQLDGVTYTSLEGDVSLEVPVGLNGQPFTLHGARLLAFRTEGMAGNNNTFFVKVSLRRFVLSWLVAQDDLSDASLNELSNIVAALPDREILIAYSDKNLDTQAINTLPQNLQDFFDGIFDPAFGIPIFNSNGSINAFLVNNLNSLPTVLTDALAGIGIDQGWVSNNLGLNGGVLNGATVENIGTLIDLMMVLFPSLQAEALKDSSSYKFPAFNIGVILPGLSLPSFMQDAADGFPIFKIIGFEPDPSVQLRYFLAVQPDVFAGGALAGAVGVEGALRANMPNIINAEALNDAPGTEPLDLRINLSAFASVAAGLTDSSVGAASADVGIQGSLQLVNYWNNPFGIQGIGFGDASILIGAQGAAGVALDNLGAGVDLFAGISGQLGCLDANNEIVGLPSKAAFYLGFKVGIPPLPTGVGLEMAPGPGGMTFAEHLRCRARMFNSVVLGMGDALLTALPDGPERDAIRSIQDVAANSFEEFERILFAPLDFAPVRHLLDGVRFSGSLYLATPGVALPNRFGTTGLASSGRIEVRDNADAPWVAIADANMGITFADGMKAGFALHDYNIADLIVMENVQGQFKLPFHNPLAANLNLTGSQRLFDLQSDTTVEMSPRDGVTIDSRTSIDNLGEMSVVGASTGTVANWPPVGPGGGIDFAGEARFDLDTNHVADRIHGAVNGVLNDANSAYRDALNVLGSRSREEQDLQRRIEDLERDIRRRTDEINDRLRPGFDDAKRRLASARRHVSNVWSDIRYYERRKEYHSDRCAWWRAWECASAAYWWGREKFARGLVWAANRALDLANIAVRGAESTLNSALYEVARTLSPRLNAYRVAIVGLRTSRDLAAITVRALQAANSEVQRIGNALRDAANIRVHDASARIDSLFNVYAGIDGVRTHTDIEVLNLRCSSDINVNLADPVGTLMGGIQAIQTACVSDLHEDANSRRKATLRKQYAADKLRQAVGLSPSAAKPGNDEVASATVIDSALPAALAADNTGADTADDEYASDLTSHTLWWRWQPPASGLYQLDALSDATDTTLQVHRLGPEAPSAGTLVAADFIPAASANLVLQLDGSRTYLIGVGSQLGLPGPLVLNIQAVEPVAAPPNDDAANAVVLTGLGGNTTGHNLSATVEAGERAGDDQSLQATVWWALDVPADGLYTVNTLGSSLDTVLRAYRHDGSGPVSAGSLAWQKTADDIAIDPRSELTLFAQQGERVWFSVGSKYPNAGQIELSWQHTALDASQLQGDRFAQPIALDATSSGVVRSNVGATTEQGEPLHAGASNAASLWYRFTAPETGNYLFDTTNSSIDTALAIYTGAGLDSLVELASSDGSRESGGLLNSISYSAFRVNLQAGEQYMLAQAGLNEAEGDLVLNVQRFALNDTFEQPASIAADGGEYSADVSQARLQTGEPDYAEILARSYLPDVVLASLTALSDTAQGAGVDVPVDQGLIDTLDTLYDGALADLRSRPVQHSLWYRYTATQSGDLNLNTLGSEPDTAIVLFTGNALDELDVLAWNDDIDNGTDSRLRYAVEQGRTYVIAVLARSSGVVRLAASLVTPEQQTVGNDTPDTAIELTSNDGEQAADNTYARPDPALDPVLGEQDGQRLWWRFDAVEAGTLVVDTQGSASDTLIEVYRDNFGALELLTLNDNFHPALNTSRVQFAVLPGHSYWIAVDTLNGGAGAVRLNHRFEQGVAGPANDRIDQATVIAGDVHAITTSNDLAQYQRGEPFIGSVLRPNTVWYQWTPSTSGLATISTQGSDIDTLLGLYLGAQASELQLLETSDDASETDTSSVIRAHVVAGVAYTIAIAGKRDVQGSYSLSIAVADTGSTQAQNTRIDAAEAVAGDAPQFAAELTHVLPDADTGSDLVEASGQEASSRWWQWRAPQDGRIVLSSQGSEVVPQLELYVGETPQRIVLLDADKGSGGDGEFSRVTATVQADRNYYIRASSPFSFQGAVDLAITYIGATEPTGVQQLAGDSGSVAAAIVAAGTRAWQWTATDDGLVQFSLSRGEPTEHTLRVYVVNAGVRSEIMFTQAMVTEDTLPSFQFVSDAGAEYHIEVTSTGPLLGNAELHYSYVNRKTIDIASPAGQAFVDALRALVTLQSDAQGMAVPVLAASRQAQLALLADVLQGSGINAEQLAIELSVAQPSGGVGTLADVRQIRVVVRDTVSREVFVSAMFRPDVSAGAAERHEQLFIDSPEFTALRFGGGDSPAETVAVQVGRGSFNQGVAQAFVSARQVDVGMLPRAADQTLLLGSTAYAINLDLYDSSGQRYPLEVDQSVLRSVQVRLPIDTQVLMNWLAIGTGNLSEAQAQVDQAIRDGRLVVARAESVDALLAGATTPVDGDLTIDLAAGWMQFTTDHFSAFGLVGLEPEPDPDAGDDEVPVNVHVDTGGSGAMDGRVLLVLLLLLALQHPRRRGRAPAL